MSPSPCPVLGRTLPVPKTTDGRSYCPVSTLNGTGTPPTVSNQFIPLVDEDPAITDQIAATTDGNHILGAHAISGGTSTLSDLDIVTATPSQPPSPGSTNYGLPHIPPAPTSQPPVTLPSTHNTQDLAGVNAATITGVVPSGNSAAALRHLHPHER